MAARVWMFAVHGAPQNTMAKAAEALGISLLDSPLMTAEDNDKLDSLPSPRAVGARLVVLN
jgi:hypothetical protein